MVAVQDHRVCLRRHTAALSSDPQAVTVGARMFELFELTVQSARPLFEDVLDETSLFKRLHCEFSFLKGTFHLRQELADQLFGARGERVLRD